MRFETTFPKVESLYICVFYYLTLKKNHTHKYQTEKNHLKHLYSACQEILNLHRNYEDGIYLLLFLDLMIEILEKTNSTVFFMVVRINCTRLKANGSYLIYLVTF